MLGVGPACAASQGILRKCIFRHHRRVKSLRSDRGRLARHVLPALGRLDVRTFTRDDVERLRDALDAKSAKGKLAWKIAANVWTVVTSMCADMMSGRKREFRVRDDNPCRDVKPPLRGARKAKQFLYPAEFLTFATCERVPLRWRRAVAIAIYTYARTRRVAIETNLMPLLVAMRRESRGKGVVVALAPQGNMARKLRMYLKRAGVTRSELHKPTSPRAPITWQDLRATGATWMAVREDDPLKIKQRCGHTMFATTEIYIREAEAVREGFGDVPTGVPRRPRRFWPSFGLGQNQSDERG